MQRKLGEPPLSDYADLMLRSGAKIVHLPANLTATHRSSPRRRATAKLLQHMASLNMVVLNQ